MRLTTLLERKAIEKGVQEGKSYLVLSEELNLSKRIVRKWEQKVKKKKNPLKLIWDAQKRVH